MMIDGQENPLILMLINGHPILVLLNAKHRLRGTACWLDRQPTQPARQSSIHPGMGLKIIREPT